MKGCAEYGVGEKRFKNKSEVDLGDDPILYQYQEMLRSASLNKVAGGFSSGLGPAQHRPRRV